MFRRSLQASRALLFASIAYWEMVVAQQQQQPDALVAEVFPEVVSPPCSCDCCQVSERFPSEVEEMSNGQSWDYKCGRPGMFTKRCPQTCSTVHNEVVFYAAKTAVDYTRFCLYKCKPMMMTIGTKCMRLSISETKNGETWDGNGRQFIPGRLPTAMTKKDPEYALPLPPEEAAAARKPAPIEVPEKPEWEKEIEKAEVAREEAVVAKERAKQQKFQVTWDMRKLVAERMRAEAGAAMAQGASAGERVRLNDHAVKRNSALMNQVKVAVEPVESGLSKNLASADTSAANAMESAREVEELFKNARAQVRKMLSDTERLSRQMIKQQTVVAAKEEAQAYAERSAWDKPDNYVRIVSNRAAEPYNLAMATAVQRITDYQGAESRQENAAKAAEANAADLESQAARMEKRGELFASISKRRQAQGLLRKSKEEHDQAKKFKEVVDETRENIYELQSAGVQAGAYAAWNYQQSHSIPPDPVLPVMPR